MIVIAENRNQMVGILPSFLAATVRSSPQLPEFQHHNLSFTAIHLSGASSLPSRFAQVLYLHEFSLHQESPVPISRRNFWLPFVPDAIVPPVAESAPASLDLTVLYRVARELLREGDYGQVLEAVLDASIDALGADRGFVLVRGDNGFRVAAARRFAAESLSNAEAEVSTSIAAAVEAKGSAVLIGDARTLPDFRNQSSVQQLSLRSVLCAPLKSADAVFALIYLENRKLANQFTERQRDLLNEICAMAAPPLRAAIRVEDSRRIAATLETRFGDSDGIITADPAFTAILQTAHKVAVTDLPVLVQGETGTGKELVARGIYRHGTRARGAFVVVNCAAIPETLIGSELFGYVRGAFTGATQDRDGFVSAAHKGTLFLDEIGDMPLELQAQLLRVLQSGEYTRLGSAKTERADVRFVAATNRDLERDVEENRFRADLFYRLAGVTLKIPPLRERQQDIAILAAHFLKQYSKRLGREAPPLSKQTMGVLCAYSFPGNVRELEGEMARLVAVSSPGETITPEMLTPRIRNGGTPIPSKLQPMSLSEAEKQLITTVLNHTGGNRTRTAEILGISREGLRVKMQRYGLSDR
jgi:transcriptional regulator with GAF, ATPase, and Fis domain